MRALSSLSRLAAVSAAACFACLHASASGPTPSDFRTPAAPPSPRINGAKIYGAKPGHPFLYRIPCTGTRPIRFSAKGLPPSLSLDENTGIIIGQTPDKPGSYVVTLHAANNAGQVSRQFTIAVGNTLGLTPQMGWNDWYTFYAHPTDGDIRAAAAQMVASGMADYGYQYVDIDDAWERKQGATDADIAGPVRNESGMILPNRRFPDMGALTDYIHSLGLKAGIYSSPGRVTCQKFEASYQHEEADARQIAQWGFDLLKYDWCSYGRVATDVTSVTLKAPTAQVFSELKLPYTTMSGFLNAQDRDIILNMCQYGMGQSWTWAREVGGNSWRTTGDLGVAKETSLPRFYTVGFANAALDAYAGPGGWNDPDYILIGSGVDPYHQTEPAKPTKLTPDEQYSYMSMWAMMASPLFFSGDMTKLDAFTLNVLCNFEVIDLDQDSLGKQAAILRKTGHELILVKQLEDGSMAVGLFNLDAAPQTMAVDWKDVQLSGKLKVRDVWRQKDLGSYSNRYASQVPAHGVMLVRVMPAHRKDVRR